MPQFSSREEYDQWKAHQAAGVGTLSEQPEPEPPRAKGIGRFIHVEEVGNEIVTFPLSRSHEPSASRDTVHVVITDVRIPFASLVLFMVQCGIAAIPAGIVLFCLGLLFSAMGIGFLGGAFGHR